MVAKVKDWDVKEGDFGNKIYTRKGAEHSWNDSDIKVVHHGVDTIKQMYQGLIKQDVLAELKAIYDEGIESHIVYKYLGCDWAVRGAGRGGYRYLLKSKELGVIIMLGSFYIGTEYHGHHLKIELSPGFILSEETSYIQTFLDSIASHFLTQKKATNVSIHLCADVQGWECPDDLDFQLVTKAKRTVRRSGVNRLEFDSHEMATSFGKAQSFTFGSVPTLQFAVYDKTKAIIDKKEDGLWLPIWRMSGDDLGMSKFDEEKQVFRLEARFHQSVIQQFAAGLNTDLNNFQQVSEHLAGLWQYALNNFRLDDSRTYINPFWQHMRDSLTFDNEPPLLKYIRKYKKVVEANQLSERSIMIIFGKLAVVYAKNKFSLSRAAQCLNDSGIMENLVEIYKAKEASWHDTLDIRMFLESDLEDKMAKALLA